MSRRFYTPAMQAWLGGYEPVAAQQAIDDKRGQGNIVQAAKQSRRRMELAGKEIPFGRGTLAGLSKKSNPNDPAKAGRIRKASKL